MIEKKRSVGALAIGTVMLLYGIIGLVLYGERLGYVCAYLNPLGLLFIFGLGNHLLDSVIFIIISAFILIKRNWARRFTIITSIILLLGHLPNAILVLMNPDRISKVAYSITSNYGVPDYEYWYGLPSERLVLLMTFMPLLLYILFVYFLTRPKIKEEFR